MSGFLSSAFDAMCGLIEVGPVKIDNELAEGLLAVGVVAAAGYATYKVLNDSQAAQNVATVIGRATGASGKSFDFLSGRESQVKTADDEARYRLVEEYLQKRK